MLFGSALIFLPVLLVFGVYHLTLWTRAFAVDRRVFWQRAGIASSVSHILLLACFSGLVWLDFRAGTGLPGASSGLTPHVLANPDFVSILWVWDPIASLVAWGLAKAWPQANWEWTAWVVFPVIGTLQWFTVGAFLGSLAERIWNSLRTPGDDLPDW